MTLLLVLAVFCLAGAAFLIGELVTAPARQRYVSVRRAATWGKMELPSGTPQEGLQERLVAPIGEVLAKWALKLNPRSSTDNVSRRLTAAGLGLRLSPTGFLALKALLRPHRCLRRLAARVEPRVWPGWCSAPPLPAPSASSAPTTR